MDDDVKEPFRHVWTTAAVRPSDRFSYFREGVCQTFCAYSPEPPHEGEIIDARLETAVLDRGNIARIETSPHRVVKTRSDLAKVDGNPLVLTLLLRGGLDGIMGGDGFALSVNQAGLLSADTTEHFTLSSGERFESININFDRSTLGGIKIRPVHYLNSPANRPLRSCIFLIAQGLDCYPREKLNHLTDAAISLLQAHLIADPEFLEDAITNTSGSRKGIYLAIRRFVAQRVARPDLSVSDVAKDFGITSRYVQMLFAEDNTTFRSFLTGLRLDNVRRDLLAGDRRQVSVRELAVRWGFRDMTTFHRNFRQMFGDTPHQVRLRNRET